MKRGKRIRSANAMVNYLVGGGTVWFAREAEIGLPFPADEWGQFGFMDVMRNIRNGHVFETVEVDEDTP